MFCQAHLIIRASIRKSISSCSEQISGSVCSRQNQSSITAIVKGVRITEPNQQSAERLATSCRDQLPPFIALDLSGYLDKYSLSWCTTGILFYKIFPKNLLFFGACPCGFIKDLSFGFSWPLLPPAWGCHRRSFQEFVPRRLHRKRHDREPWENKTKTFIRNWN